MKQTNPHCGQTPDRERTPQNSKPTEEKNTKPEGCFARWGKMLLVFFLIALCINIVKSCNQDAKREQQRIEDERRRKESMEAFKSLYSMTSPRDASRPGSIDSDD